MHITRARARLAALVLGGIPAFACGGGGGGDGGGTDGTDSTGTTTSVDATSVATMTTATTTATSVTVTATTTVGPSDTGTVPEPCCAATGVPGCAEDPDVAACVCEVDRYCCESVWDEVCAEKVVSLGCGVCDPGPSTMTTTASSTSPTTTSDVTTGQPPDNVGPCCSAHPETGCELPSISECVCAAEPSCCNDEWHDGCVDAVDANGCGVCPPDPTTTTMTTTDPDTGVPPDNTEGCCSTHDSTGCEYPAIAECVCAENPACCDIAWDDACVDAVGALGCGVCPP